MMIKGYRLAAQATQNYSTAINYYKKLRDVCEEDGNMKTKLDAYYLMGNQYSLRKSYKKAILCYKKMLEVAWSIRDERSELLAYQMIGLQYYYLGQLDRSKYYHMRHM